MNFQQKLDKIIKKNNSLVCVGLDSNVEKIPRLASPARDDRRYVQFEFNREIIDQTYDLVCAYKINSAFYEAVGAKGIEELKITCDYLRKKYPIIPIIIDAKRADIGNTNKGYIKYVFNYLGADAITLHPYLGREAVEPFLQKKDKGIIILCKTSNIGSGELQDLIINGQPLYKIVAQKVAKEWNLNKNCLLVVGATYPKELKEVRKIVGDITLLIPGIGKQGGSVEEIIKVGLNSKKSGLIINSSRGIIFAKNPREETERLRGEINKYR